MRIAFAAAGLAVLMGIGGAYVLMCGPSAPKQLPVVAQIPKTESVRLFVLSAQVAEPAKPISTKAAKVATPSALRRAKDIASKKDLARPAKAEAKSSAPKQLAKAKST